jgi:hypothetical protein
MKNLSLLAFVFGIFISFSTHASPEFRVYGRLFNPNHCAYFSTIEGEFVIETTNNEDLGLIAADAETKLSYARNQPESWINVSTPLSFTNYITHDRTYLDRTELKMIVTSRGSYSYEAIRFKVRSKNGTFPEGKNDFFYVKFSDVLRIGCDPETDEFTQLPVSVECFGDAEACAK